MLDRLEKIQWVASGLFVVLFVGMFVYPGLPTPVATILPPMVQVKAKEFEDGLGKPQLKAYRDKISKASVRKKTLNKKSRAAQKPSKHERHLVPNDVYYGTREKRLASSQLRFAKTEQDLEAKTIKITMIDSGSYLKDLDFQVNDVVESLDGEKIPLGDEGACWDLYDEKLGELEAGGTIVVTLNRGGTTVYKSFRLDDLKRR